MKFFETCWGLSSSKCSSAISNQQEVATKKRKRIGFYSRYLFYSLSLHAFQVSTQIDFLITQTYFTSFTTTKNGFDMTKEKLTAFLTTTLNFRATSFPKFFALQFLTFHKSKQLSFCVVSLILYHLYVIKEFTGIRSIEIRIIISVLIIF